MGTTTETTKHTPGPWHLSKHTRFVRKSYGTTGDGPKDYNICEVWLAGDDEGAISQANARLIAAAPELLAACKALCKRLESNELVNRPDNPCNQYDQPAYDAALAAIAKAEGTTP